ncbi:MAG: hypothetical protein II685_05360 [Clostridia bacterium]|nr:hypothetical protein [Clostridia bacterium]
MAEIIFKDFTADNLFDFCSLLDAVGAEEVINAFDEKEIKALQRAEENVEKIGIVILMKIVKIIIKNIPKSRNEICMFLSNCTVFDNGTETTADDLRDMKIVPFARLLKALSKREDLADFFGEAAELLGSEQKNLKNLSTGDTQTQKDT